MPILPAMRGLILAIAIGAACSAAKADPRPAVVELFTSQGCSDCPPAEAFLGELAQRPDVVALAYHVDYWDNLGWKDPFSFSAATQRQRNYARRLGLDYVYTPQMVIDGRRDAVGSDREAVAHMLKGTHDGVALRLRRVGGDLVAEIGAGAAAARGELLVIAYDQSAETKVPRGENAGRTLREFDIVRAIYRLGEWNGAATELRLPVAKLPAAAGRVALLLQEPDQGAILGAATAAVP